VAGAGSDVAVSTSSPRVAQMWALTGGLDGGSGGRAGGGGGVGKRQLMSQTCDVSAFQPRVLDLATRGRL
jgi:hypothetical protein